MRPGSVVFAFAAIETVGTPLETAEPETCSSMQLSRIGLPLEMAWKSCEVHVNCANG
jgi:hypothetical protein